MAPGDSPHGILAAAEQLVGNTSTLVPSRAEDRDDRLRCHGGGIGCSWRNGKVQLDAEETQRTREGLK